MYRNIIVSLSLDHGIGFRAMEVARRLKAEDGQIVAVHVCEPVHATVSLYVPPEHTEKVHRDAQAAIAERIGEQKDVEAVVLTGHQAQAIIDYARESGADCIVVGAHGPEKIDYFLGSTASRIARHAPCSVHVVR